MVCLTSSLSLNVYPYADVQLLTIPFYGRIRRVRPQAEMRLGLLLQVISYWRLSPFKSQKELSKNLGNEDLVVSGPVLQY